MVKSFFITGTDTDVGKTLVARTLLLEFVAHGIQCAGYKPISAGCARTPDGLRNLDAVLLQEAASLSLPYDMVNPYAFEPPIAPHIAALEADRPIDLKVIQQALEMLQTLADVIWVEHTRERPLGLVAIEGNARMSGEHLSAKRGLQRRRDLAHGPGGRPMRPLF